MKETLTKPEIGFFLSILIPLLALAISWGVFTARLAGVEARQESLEIEHANQRKTNEEIQVRLAEIQKDILYIREKLDSHVIK